MSAPETSVFINCPFDEDYAACFRAILFTLIVSGYAPRCALEDNDGANLRADKLCKLIEQSDRSIHDLSRIEVGPEGFPRFNMPFELGLMMGAKRFGGRRQRTKTALIMVAARYNMPRYLSDLAGNDPETHGADPNAVIQIVRDHLHTDPTGKVLPGAAYYRALFEEFQNDLPALAARVPFTADEIHPFRAYRNYREMLARFAETVHQVAEQ